MMKPFCFQLVCVILAVMSCAAESKPATPSTSRCEPTATTAQATDSNSHSEFSERYPRYKLAGGDAFDVVFEFVPDFNQHVTVQPDGFITLREIGDLHVAGMTVPELTGSICRAYSKILYDPAVAVNLKDFDKPYFTVSGQVGRPGKYTLRSATTVTEAIAIAGGFTEKSKHSQVVLFRRASSEWTEARLLDVKQMLGSRSLKEDLYLRPGDMIFVPQNKISKIAHFLPKPMVSTYVNPNQF